MSQFKLGRHCSLGETKKQIVAFLTQCGVQEGEACAEADIAVEHVAGWPPWKQVVNLKESLSEDQLVRLDSLMHERMKRVPIQYLLETAYFMGLPLLVKPGVFIPRPDTETLAHSMIDTLEYAIANEKFLSSVNRDRPVRKFTALEIGVGSGAISIALLMRNFELDVVAVDVSETALEVAQENARRFNVASRLKLLKEGEWWKLGMKFQALVSNPPYIPLSMKDDLQPEVGWHEPAAALFGDDEDGMGFYRRIAREARVVLEPPAYIGVEVGDGQAQAVSELFEEAGFTEIRVLDDVNGLPRAVTATVPN